MTTLDVLQKKLDAAIARNKDGAFSAFQKMSEERNLLSDFIVPPKKMEFFFDSNELKMKFHDLSGFRVHQNALGQIAQRNNIPISYLKSLSHSSDEWRHYLAEEILNTHTNNTSRERMLIRAVGSEVRGILSDRYRRFDSMKIFESFLQASVNHGAILYNAFHAPTRTFIEVILPEIFTIPTEKNKDIHIAWGVQIKNSDFGNGALDVKAIMIQVVCTNGMTFSKILHAVHLGSELPDNIELSEKTIRLDTERSISFINDATSGLFKREFIETNLNKVIDASNKEVDLKEEVKKLPKIGLLLGEAEDVEKILLANREDDGVIGEPTLWKFAQAVGAVARDAEPERSRDLMDIAGKMIFG